MLEARDGRPLIDIEELCRDAEPFAREALGTKGAALAFIRDDCGNAAGVAVGAVG